jgi:predicted RNase H-like HicB family nuclease
MKVYRVMVEQEGDWYCARAMEDPGVFTQGRTLDEIIANVREVAALMYDEKNVQVELVVPPGVSAGGHRGRGSRGRIAKTSRRVRRSQPTKTV